MNSGIEKIDLTIVIPTRNRPHELEAAVESALRQVGRNVEVIVVDDGSDRPVRLPSDSQLRCIRLDRSRGVAHARNTGLAAARGQWISFLDDDDTLLPEMATTTLSALASANARPPVAVISGIEVVGKDGKILERRIPPSYDRGLHFSLEPLPTGCSHVTKNTLVVDRELLMSLGGFDTSLTVCEWIDLFLRLNAECSIVGIPVMTYRLSREPSHRLSRDLNARRIGFCRLVAKHRHLFAGHPQGFADALLGEARQALAAGSPIRSIAWIAWALRVEPLHTLWTLLNPSRAIRLARGLHASG
jgi:glycosyltransferase involved in cell wall biosynthesis